MGEVGWDGRWEEWEGWWQWSQWAWTQGRYHRKCVGQD